MGKSLLALPAGQAAAKHLKRLSRQADAACQRLADPEDAEALHDFRVAIRRARSWLAAYHPYLPLDKPLRRRLRDLARRTNAARDAEVSIAGLQDLSARLTAAQRVGLSWLLAQLEEDRQRAYADILVHIPVTWPSLGRDLRRRLRHPHGASPRFSQAAFELATAAETVLAQRLQAIVGWEDIGPLHQARIATKRLRYLLEPCKGEVAGMEVSVARLTALQDGLGALHDGHVLLGRLAVATETAACRRARHLVALTLADPAQGRLAARRGHGEQTGLLALLGLTVMGQHRRFAEVQDPYLGAGLQPFLADMERTIARLAD